MQKEDRQPLELPVYESQLECGTSPSLQRRGEYTLHADISRTQVGAFTMCCAIYNFIFCPRLGIPALIFAILGKEAEKRNAIEEAKSHAYHSKIFNIIAIFIKIFYLVACVTSVIIFIVVVVRINSTLTELKDQLPTNRPYSSHYP